MEDLNPWDKLAQVQTPPQNPMNVWGSSVFDQALEQYPILQQHGLQYKDNPQAGSNMLEFWPPNEPGTPERPRPKGFEIGKPGVEVYNPNTRPIDILGDVTSHHLINVDPKVKDYYSRFEKSLSSQQQQNLQEQYAHAKQNEGEARSFEDWKKSSGLPAYFRGYAFQQWPKESIPHMYSSDQLRMFDEMMRYLQGRGE